MSKLLLYNKISPLNKEIVQISGSELCAAGNTFPTEQQQNVLSSTQMNLCSAVREAWGLFVWGGFLVARLTLKISINFFVFL